MIEYSEDERALLHLANCVTQLRALPDQIIKCETATLRQACIESYLVNYRLLFEFFDDSVDKKDFGAQTLLTNWTHEFTDDAKKIRDSASKHVVHFSLERLIPEVVEQEFPLDPVSLKAFNELLEVPLLQFKNKLLVESPTLGKLLDNNLSN